MSSIAEIIKGIQDSQNAQIAIPVQDGAPVRLKCVYKESVAPAFFLVFAPKELPENIDLDTPCHISIDGLGDTAPITLTAVIERVKGDRTLELVGKTTIDPTSMRDYFRVDMRAPILAQYNPNPEEHNAKPWTLRGESLDMSASGVLAIFPNEFVNHHRIQLRIALPHLDYTVKCEGRLIRQNRLRKNRWQIALTFEKLEQKDRDALISSCLQEQRKQLREKVQIT